MNGSRGRWLVWLLGGTVLYGGVVLVLWFLENKLVYHPRSAVQDWQPPPAATFQDVFFTSAEGTQLHGWWCPRRESACTVLYCHGNAGNLSHRGYSLLALQEELEASVFIFDYPGYGKSGGRPSEAGCYAAAEAAYDWLVQQAGVPAEQLIFYGGSLGGGVAVELACRRPRYRALILAKTFTSLPEVAQHLFPWLPARWLMRNRFDNLSKLGRCHGPVVLAQATADRLIPWEHGPRLFAAAPSPKLFYPLEGADHNDPLPREFFRAVRQFLEQTAQTTPSE